jgi:hypothetical protein
MSQLVEIDVGVFVRPEDVVSIEDQEYWNSHSPSDSFLESTGCRMILKNGQKLYLKAIRAIDAHDMLFPKVKDIVPCPEAPRAILIPGNIE